jgi:hypothetical protein
LGSASIETTEKYIGFDLDLSTCVTPMTFSRQVDQALRGKKMSVTLLHVAIVVSGQTEGTITMQLINQAIYRLDHRFFQAHYNSKANTWFLCETEAQGAYRVGSQGQLFEITYEVQTGFYDIAQTPSVWTMLDLESVQHPENENSNVSVDMDVSGEAFLDKRANR